MRETDGLMEALNKYNLQKGIILTMENETDLVFEKKQIKVIPVWKWLLQGKNEIFNYMTIGNKASLF